MKKPERKFEVVALAEVLKKVSVISDNEQNEQIGNTTTREERRSAGNVAPTDTPHKLKSYLRVQSENRDPHLQSETADQEAMPRRVLVVDDERIIADTLATILRHAGYEALASYDGIDALSLCDSFSPDLIISDVVMPQMSGVKMAIAVRQRHPACKVLLFSGQAATASLLAEARQSGYDFEFLEKPMNPKDLLAKISGEARPPQREVQTSDSASAGSNAF
jgi:CheY-like chemotaxis protein